MAALAVLPSPAAYASCDQVGANVTCTGTTSTYDSGAQANLNVTVQQGATVLGSGNIAAIKITSNTTATLTNNGLIDGFANIVSGNAGSDTFTNNGVLRITDPTANIQEHSMAGTNFSQTANGSFFARVDNSGAFFDGILSWSAALNGKLVVVVQPGTYGASTTYSQFINTITGTTGNFSSIASSSPFFTAELLPNGNDRDLVLSFIGFGAVQAMTRNQQSVAAALDGSYDSNTVSGNAATFYGNLFAATSVAVFDQLSGEGISAAQSAAFGAGSLFNGAMQSQGLFGPNLGGLSIIVPPAQYAQAPRPRGHEAFAALRPATEASEPGRWRVWAAGFGATRSLAGEASTGSSRQSIQNFGGSLGVDRRIAPDLVVGIAAGASESGFSVRDLSTSGRLTGGHIGLYAVKTWGAYYAAAALSYARFDNSTTRTITGVGPTETASGRFGSNQLSGRLELGWKQAYSRYTLTPFVAIEPAALWQSGYTESSVPGSAGILGLDVASHTATSVPTFLGVQVDARHVTPEGAIFAPFARASWVHEFEPNRQVTASFVSVPSAVFTVDGARAASDAARVDAGGKLTFRTGHTMFANFAGEWSDRTEGYAATGGFRTIW